MDSRLFSLLGAMISHELRRTKTRTIQCQYILQLTFRIRRHQQGPTVQSSWKRGGTAVLAAEYKMKNATTGEGNQTCLYRAE